MAKEEKPAGIGEISMIRDILMGQHINEFQKNFDAADEKTNQLNQLMDEKFKVLEGELRSHMGDMENNMNARLDSLESMLKDNVADLEWKISDTSKNDKDMIGQMLQEMGKKLISGK
jgi:hypothetical protein